MHLAHEAHEPTMAENLKATKFFDITCRYSPYKKRFTLKFTELPRPLLLHLYV